MKTMCNQATAIAFVTAALSFGVCIPSWAASFTLPNEFNSELASEFGTSLYFYSESGDFIGQGREWFYEPTAGNFEVRPIDGNSGVDFRFNNFGLVGFQESTWWGGRFAAPASEALVVGSYIGTTRFPFQDFNVPGLSVTGDGRGCNRSGGRFDVLEIGYNHEGNVASFDAIFAQYCENESAVGTPALFGQLRFNADNRSVSVPEPSSVLSLIICCTLGVWGKLRKSDLGS